LIDERIGEPASVSAANRCNGSLPIRRNRLSPRPFPCAQSTHDVFALY
jgi:hypothetical protein